MEGGLGGVGAQRSVIEAAHKAQEEAQRCAVCRIKIKHMRREAEKQSTRRAANARALQQRPNAAKGSLVTHIHTHIHEYRDN